MSAGGAQESVMESTPAEVAMKFSGAPGSAGVVYRAATASPAPPPFDATTRTSYAVPTERPVISYVRLSSTPWLVKLPVSPASRHETKYIRSLSPPTSIGATHDMEMVVPVTRRSVSMVGGDGGSVSVVTRMSVPGPRPCRFSAKTRMIYSVFGLLLG